jgi:D-alanine-D-alanine ligase
VEAIKAVWEMDDRAMLESRILGRELTCAVIGDETAKALPPIEIIPAEGHVFFDYSAKYEPGEAQEICPADLSERETLTAQNLAIAAHLAIGCRGLSRTDFILDARGVFYILEINTMPGLTKNSLTPKAAAAAGYTLSAFLDELIMLALKQL